MTATAVALYARVSTKDKQDTENQLIQLREYCAKKGWTIAREYVDRMSGKRSDNRKEFQAMLTDASQRKFDVLLVWALDRLSREGIHETFEHIKKLRGYGVEFESYSEAHFRTTGPAGELMLAVAAWIAKQERARIVERVTSGMEKARKLGTKSGKSIGRPRVVVDRDRVKHLHARGIGMREIARQFKIAPMTVQRIVA